MPRGALNGEISFERRLCKVKDRIGYFHMWEQYSKTIEASPFDVFNRVFGIVEFETGVERVDPTDIQFIDEENQALKDINKYQKWSLCSY